MANDFDDFEDDAFGGTATANAFDSFDDDAFRGPTATKFDDVRPIAPPAAAWPLSKSKSAGPPPLPKIMKPYQEALGSATSRRESDFDAPPPPGPPPEDDSDFEDFENDNDLTAPPPPPPPPPPPFDIDEEDEDNYPPPPKAGSSKSRNAPPVSLPPPPYESEDEEDEYTRRDEPPPPPEPPNDEDYANEDEQGYEEDFAPPPNAPPSHESRDDYGEDFEEYDAPPPPTSPPPPASFASASQSRHFQTSEEEAAPPPGPPPEDEYTSAEDEDGLTEEAPPPPPPPFGIDEDEEGVANDHDLFEPPEPPSQPPPDYETDGEEDISPSHSSPPPPPPNKPLPPPVPVRTGDNLVKRATYQAPSQTITEVELPPENDVPRSTLPMMMVASPPSQEPQLAPQEESETEAAFADLPSPTFHAGEAPAPIVLLPAPAAPVKDTSPVVTDLEEKEESPRRDSQQSLMEAMQPPSHPPPPQHPPPRPDAQASHLRRSSSSLLPPNEEKQVALRFLRAVETQTRTLNQRLIRSARDVYAASDLDENGQVSFVELAAALKMIDPELSVDQAMRFVSGLSVQAKIRQNRDYFASVTEFEAALSAAAGVDIRTLEENTEGEEADRGYEPEQKSEIEDASAGVRSLEQYAFWIDSLEIWPVIDDIVEALKTGVLLCKLVEYLLRRRDDPGFRMKGINTKPRTRAPCVHNIEAALSIVWKQRVAARNMPSAERIYNGDPIAVQSLLKEIFSSMALPSHSQKEMFEWFNGVLKHYADQKELATHVKNPPHRGLWAAFGGGDALACVLHFFCGPEGSDKLPAVDLGRVFVNPARVREVRANAVELFSLLPKCSIPRPWRVEDFVLAQDHEMLLVQLTNIYLRFKDNACALPLVVPGGAIPAISKQYVVVDQEGEVSLVGVTFRDASSSKEAETVLSEEKALLNIPSSATRKRSFTGFHSFASDDGHVDAQSHHEGELSSEVFFLVNPGLTVPPPPVVSDALAKSSMVSLERAMARASVQNDAMVPIRRLSSPLPPQGVVSNSLITRASMDDPVAEIRARMRQRLYAAGQARGATTDDERRASEERKQMALEDDRRRAFLKRTHGSSLDKEDFVERTRSALAWLHAPHDVDFHNRNSTDRCKVFVAPVESSRRDYALEWFDANDETDSGSVLLSEVYEIVTSAAEDGSVYILVHLNHNHAVKTSKGRPILKLQPVKQQDALRFFANLNVLLEEVRLAGGKRDQKQSILQRSSARLDEY